MTELSGRLPALRGKGGLKEAWPPRPFAMPPKPTLRRRGPRRLALGLDELEQRAAQGIEGTLPERIVYKALIQLEVRFNYKYGVYGARRFRGGFEIDFEIVDRYPPVALEAIGLYWHGPEKQYQDMARALVFLGLGYRYEEIAEPDIYQSADHLEQVLRTKLGIPAGLMRREDLEEWS